MEWEMKDREGKKWYCFVDYNIFGLVSNQQTKNNLTNECKLTGKGAVQRRGE